MQCRARHEGAVSSRNHVSWRRNRVSVKCQCPRYLTGALPCRRRKRPSGGSARPSGDEQAPPRMFLPAAFPGTCPARGEPFAEDGRDGSRLSGHLRQFENLCHAGGESARAAAPVRRSARPERPAHRPVAPFRKGTLRPSGRAGCAGPEGFRAVLAPGRGPGPGAVAQPSGFPCGEQAPNLEPGHVASKYVVARSVAKCLSDLRTVPVA